MAHTLLIVSAITYKREWCTLLIISNLHLEKWNGCLWGFPPFLDTLWWGDKRVNLFPSKQTVVLVTGNPIVSQGWRQEKIGNKNIEETNRSFK